MLKTTHRIFHPGVGLSIGDTFEVEGAEAHHAVRVKRTHPGAMVEILSGDGQVAMAEVVAVKTKHKGQAELQLHVVSVEGKPPVLPRVIVRCPAPKGDALVHMIDQLSQVGADTWSHLRTDHSEREPRKPDRLERTAIESLKQCGRAYLMRLEPACDLRQILARPSPGMIVADAEGTHILPPIGESVELLLGPEGGWSPDERQLFKAMGIPIVRFGPHVLRIETAAVAGVACILHQAHQSGAGS